MSVSSHRSLLGQLLLPVAFLVAACAPVESDPDRAAVAAAADVVAGGDHDFLPMGSEYTAAWNSRDPAQVAAFFAEDGTLTINGGQPSVGRAAIEDTVQSYMSAYPDFVLRMDRIDELGGMRFRYAWTFTGTHSGPGGTDRKVVFSGHEDWQVSDLGEIAASAGHYDAADYERQLGRRSP